MDYIHAIVQPLSTVENMRQSSPQQGCASDLNDNTLQQQIPPLSIIFQACIWFSLHSSAHMFLTADHSQQMHNVCENVS